MSRTNRDSLHVLVLNQHYWPEIAATAQLLSDLCEDLSVAGHRVSVICGQPSYRSSGETLPAREEHHGVEITRVWAYAPEKRSIPRRLVHYGSYFAGSLERALRVERPDVCLVLSTPPLLLGLSGIMLNGLRGVPFVYSVQDLYPDIAVHLGVLQADSLVTRAIGRISNALYGRANAIVTLSHAMGERLVEKGVTRGRVHVVPNWADTSAIKPSARDNAFAREHGLADRFVVQYSGNLGLSQGLDAVLDAAELLRNRPITFALVGDGNARLALETRVREQNLTNVRFLPPQPRQALSELLGACDVGLVPMKRGVGSDLVPSKLYGIMAAARPVLASVEPISEVANVVAAHGCGWVVAPESGGELASGIMTAFESSPLQRAQMGEQGRKACTETYSRAAATARYETVLRGAVGRARAVDPLDSPVPRPTTSASY